jgi:hypothetical protein
MTASKKILYVFFFSILFFNSRAFAQEVVMATTEDIQEFDRLIANTKNPLPAKIAPQASKAPEVNPATQQKTVTRSPSSYRPPVQIMRPPPAHK